MHDYLFSAILMFFQIVGSFCRGVYLRNIVHKLRKLMPFVEKNLDEFFTAENADPPASPERERWRAGSAEKRFTTEGHPPASPERLARAGGFNRPAPRNSFKSIRFKLYCRMNSAEAETIRPTVKCYLSCLSLDPG